MLDSHCLHRFQQCQIQSFNFCSECGCLKYNDIITLKPKEFSNPKEIDPMEQFSQMREKLKKLEIEPKVGPSCIENVKISQRKRSIAFIKYLMKKFNLEERIYHACISLMDYLLKISPEEFLVNTDMNILSCFLILIKFGENGCDSVQIKNFVLNTKEKQDMFNEYESKILKWINFDLGLFFLDYDLLNFLLYNGIIFEKEKVENLPYVYFNCFLLLNSIKEKNFYTKFNSFQIAFSIVFVMRNAIGLENGNKYFEEIYDFHLDDFRECYDTLKGQIKPKKAKVNRLI